MRHTRGLAALPRGRAARVLHPGGLAPRGGRRGAVHQDPPVGHHRHFGPPHPRRRGRVGVAPLRARGGIAVRVLCRRERRG